MTANTILGTLWGSLIASRMVDDEVNRCQLLECIRNSLKNGKFRPVEYCQELKKILDERLSADKILVQVTNHELCKTNPTRAASLQ